MAEQAKLAKELEAEERNLRKCTEEVFETERAQRRSREAEEAKKRETKDVTAGCPY